MAKLEQITLVIDGVSWEVGIHPSHQEITRNTIDVVPESVRMLIRQAMAGKLGN